MRFLRTRRSVASLAAVVTAAAVVGAVLATPATASPTTHRRHGPPEIQLLDASAHWVVYAVNENVYVRSTKGGKPIDVHGYSDSFGQEIAGDFLWYSPKNSADERYKYLNLRTGAKGRAPTRWQVATPDGGAWTAVDKKDGKIHGYDQNAATGAVTDFGALPGLVRAKHVGTGAAEADEHGILFAQGNDRTDRVREDYVAFARPGQVTRLDMHGVGDYASCSLANNALGCANSYLDIAYFGRQASLYSNSRIVRIPLNGHTQQKTIKVNVPELPKHAHPYIEPALTTTLTGWTFGLDSDDSYGGPVPAFRLHSVPANAPAGHRVSSGFQIADPSYLVTGGNRIFVVHDGKARTAGIYTVSAAGTSQKLFLHI